MKRQFAVMLASTAVLGITTAFAANPFSDVTPDSWAYQSVSQLASAGIINGYPDGTFKGQKDITRFEMAQMVAKAMANQDRANAEQQAMINRLADEFSNELNNLGVRVGRLEDRVGNVKVTGDVRFLVRHSSKKNGRLVSAGGQYYKPTKYDVRGRLQFNAKVNDRTDVVARIQSYSMELGDAFSDYETETRLDRLYVNHKFGEHTSVKAGRFNQTIGNGLLYDDAFDGIQLTTGNDKIQLQVAHGYASAIDNETRFLPEKDLYNYVGLKGKLNKHIDLGGFYSRHRRFTEDYYHSYGNLYGVSTDMNFNKVWIGGELVKAVNTDHSNAWTAGIGYGRYDQAKKGSWDVKAQYFSFGENLGAYGSKWKFPYDANNIHYDITATTPTTNSIFRGFKGWLATVDYALQDNVGISAYYGFKNKTNRIDGSLNEYLANYYRVELNYQF